MRTQIEWHWRFKKDKMPLNWALISLGGAAALILVKPTILWLGITIAVYLVTWIVDYLWDTKAFAQHGILFVLVSLGFEVVAIISLIIKFLIHIF